jgi:pimeloyl-ACP methyl ester carboxylesterase
MTPNPHPTVDDLHAAIERFRIEATPNAFHTGRYRMRYWTWGDGPTVVFVHGMADTTRSFAMEMAEMVDRGFRCVGYELPNGLDDDAVLGMYRHPHYGDDLVALLDHLNLPTAFVQGSSFGSTITISAVARYPDRFPRVVLQGGFPRRPLKRIERGLARLGRYWGGRMHQLPIRPKVMEKLEKHQFVGCPDEVFEYLLACSGTTPNRAAALRTLIIDTIDLRPMLGRIRQPVLMIGGDRDALVPRPLEAELEEMLPDVRRVEFSPCGHYPQYTVPRPMAEAVADFLRR